MGKRGAYVILLFSLLLPLVPISSWGSNEDEGYFLSATKKVLHFPKQAGGDFFENIYVATSYPKTMFWDARNAVLMTTDVASVIGGVYLRNQGYTWGAALMAVWPVAVNSLIARHNRVRVESHKHSKFLDRIRKSQASETNT